MVFKWWRVICTKLFLFFTTIKFVEFCLNFKLFTHFLCCSDNFTNINSCNNDRSRWWTLDCRSTYNCTNHNIMYLMLARMSSKVIIESSFFCYLLISISSALYICTCTVLWPLHRMLYTPNSNNLVFFSLKKCIFISIFQRISL